MRSLIIIVHFFKKISFIYGFFLYFILLIFLTVQLWIWWWKMTNKAILHVCYFCIIVFYWRATFVKKRTLSTIRMVFRYLNKQWLACWIATRMFNPWFWWVNTGALRVPSTIRLALWTREVSYSWVSRFGICASSNQGAMSIVTKLHNFKGFKD